MEKPPAGLWRQPDFLKLWAGQAVSRIGSQITGTGLPILALKMLGASPMQMGILSGAGAATVLIFGLFAGAWADRVRRRPLLITADLGRALLLATIPFAAFTHRLGMSHLYVIAAAAGVLTVVFDVAYQAYVPSLVDHAALVEANSKLALSDSIAQVSGPGLAGILIEWLTAPIAIAFDAASFLFSAASLWWIGTPERRPGRAPAPHIFREIAEGIRICARNPILRALILRTATGAFFIGFYAGLYFLFAMRELRLNAVMLGLVVAAGGASNLAGAFLTQSAVRRLGVGPAAIAAAVVLGVTSLLPPLAHGSVAICCAFLVAGQLGDAAWPLTNVCDLSIRQTIATPSVLGRVNSAMHLMFHGVYPAGALAAGALAGPLGVRPTMFIGGAGFLLSTLFLVFSPIQRLRELPQQATAATPV